MPGEMRGRPRGFRLPLEVDTQGLPAERVELRLSQFLAPDHLFQHRVAALQGSLGIEHRVVVTVALEHADQRRALQYIELVGRGIEIGACRHLDAVGVVEEGHGVEVGFEDFVLAVDGLDLQRRDRLLDLARQRLVPADRLGVEVAGKLLGEGRTPLAIAAEGVERGSRGASPVETEMVVEAVIFRGDQGVDDLWRNLGESHPLPVGLLELGQFPAIRREDLSRLLR
jgi:hypothetical protein